MLYCELKGFGAMYMGEASGGSKLKHKLKNQFCL